LNTKTISDETRSSTKGIVEQLNDDLKVFVVAKQNMGQVEKWTAFGNICDRYKAVFASDFILKQCNETIRKMGFVANERE
jgi:hypothetical protein